MCEFLPALTPSQKSWSSTHRWLSRYSITSTSCRVIDSASKICRNVIFIDVGDCKLVSYIKILISCKFYSYISMIQMYILELILLFFFYINEFYCICTYHFVERVELFFSPLGSLLLQVFYNLLNSVAIKKSINLLHVGFKDKISIWYIRALGEKNRVKFSHCSRRHVFL